MPMRIVERYHFAGKKLKVFIDNPDFKHPILNRQQIMGEFTDKVVLITGAGKGIGREIALAMGEQGARIAANDISPVNVDITVERIQAGGGQAKAFLADVASKLAVQTMVHQIHDSWGIIDILINGKTRPFTRELWLPLLWFYK